jgi:hypothetical protein
VIAAPTIELRIVPFQHAETERARREWVYGARERARLRKIEEREAAKRAAAAEHAESRAAERERTREAKAARADLETVRRVAGVCLDCGGPIEPRAGRGRPPARCEQCRTSASQ